MEKESLEKLQIKKGEYQRGKGISKKIWIFLSFLILLAVYLLFFYHRTITVDVMTVNNIYPYQSITVLNASGYVSADRKSAIGAKVTGRLVKVYVEEGMRVRKGDILAELESDDVRANYQQALANLEASRENINFAMAELEDAKKNFERVKVLFDRGFATQSEFDLAESRYKKAQALLKSSQANYNSAKANLNNAEVQLEYTKLRAPFNGIILTKDADIGDIITPLGSSANAKAAVVTMADMNSLYVEADVSESYIEKIKRGQRCIISFDAIPERVFEGYVHMVVPTVDRTKSSITVKVKFIEKSEQILPDMSAKISFLERPLREDEKDRKLLINKSFVKVEGDKYFVFVIKNNIVEKREIKIEREENKYLFVKEGINTGEKIAIRPLDKLKDKIKVKIEAK
ncbi:MAG: efflux RND transporter periplasmic adaptor subunit [Proteobacteria bacterium]|nr:efflux RND transporter periplasmic adaptor subunit [Pseudomonadota bacterium]